MGVSTLPKYAKEISSIIPSEFFATLKICESPESRAECIICRPAKKKSIGPKSVVALMDIMADNLTRSAEGYSVKMSPRPTPHPT